MAAAAGESTYSYFEFSTVLAALIFCRAGADVVIWETGLGGRLDATNAVMSCASVITNIALDHQKLLGNTLAAIAAEKAGILKKGVPLFYNRLPDEAKTVIEGRARELGIEVFPPAAPVPVCEGYSLSEQGMMCQHFTYRGEKVTLPLPGFMSLFTATVTLLDATSPPVNLPVLLNANVPLPAIPNPPSPIKAFVDLLAVLFTETVWPGAVGSS